jgi:hypothetical protein
MLPEEFPPVIMWDPTNGTTTNPQQEMCKSTPLASRDAPSNPTWIKDNHNNVEHLPPPSSIHQRTRNQFLCPSNAGPTTRSQLQAQTAHMINCVIAAELMPSTINPASTLPAAIGYAFTAHQLAIENQVAHHFIGAVIDDKTGNMLKYRHLVKNENTRALWVTSFANKIGWLFQGILHLKGTNTCFFIRKAQVLLNKRTRYGCICCNFCPQKEEQHHTCLTVSGDPIDYPGNKATPTADLTTAKLLINSTISTPGAIFLGIDLANFFLNTPMPNPTSEDAIWDLGV